ncbi:FKBP-type peptidyl-prolyl cis-trans isomerase [Haloferula luteola]|uniref:Peptidyl-prolyl cis-trans isomerase n=1 Tax=Haloferula luteola TaxID=595692 RepID=A0A840VEA6_9BACT|nr:FKBP-type peptidyl-prolyl cis-trans isomerase [Haloferula luteola]MBB5351171.1 FKBP-type peptidyl-prolyl cis-trans isomerase [Haloferula luteola]
MTQPFLIGTLAFGLASLIPVAAQETAPTPPVEAPAADPATVKPDSSYALGYRTGGEFGQRYGNFGITPDDLQTESFLAGFLAGFKGEDPAISEEKLGAAMQALGDLLQGREKEVAASNLETGKAFLAENAKKDGIKTTESGLQYQVLEPGGEETYQAPKEGEPDKEFLVNYRGTLIDGTEFDASPEGESVPMTLQVIDGFKEALQAMPIGAKWRLYIPSELAYGDQRRSAEIGPNSVLIFEVELEKIQDAPAAPAGMPFQLPGAQE